MKVVLLVFFFLIHIGIDILTLFHSYTTLQDTSLAIVYATIIQEMILDIRKTRIQMEKLLANIIYYFRMAEFKMYVTVPMMMAFMLM